jgi:hypothetical protein
VGGSSGGSLPANIPGNGGTGIVSSITGSAIQYAGGGGAGGSNGGLASGGGGSGGLQDSLGTSRYNGNTGLANTGGGGGGGGFNNSAGTNGIGSAGGSGIVVIRYPSGQGFPQSTTGGPRTYVTGPYRVYVWVSSGTITF